MTPLRRRDDAREIERYCRTLQVAGIDLSIRCFLVQSRRPYYEIFISSATDTAAFDVPAIRESTLPIRIDEAVRGFVACRLADA